MNQLYGSTHFSNISFFIRFDATHGSYLNLPRLSFTGHMRVDVNTVNNIPCNFDLEEPLGDPSGYQNWNVNGTGEISFVNCTVSSAITHSGMASNEDTVINGQVVNNLNEPYPKAVDLDVDYQFTTIYGLTITIVKSDGQIALKGKLVPMIMVQDMWIRSICTNFSVEQDNNFDHYLSAKSASVLTNVQWYDISGSPALQQLQAASEENGGNLSISLAMFFNTRVVPQFMFTNFTLAYVVGTIGISSTNEPLMFNGNRLLSYQDIEQPDLPLNSNDSCYQFQVSGSSHPVWMYKAPFQIDSVSRRLSVDLSNAISQNLDGSLRNLGELWFGIRDDVSGCIQLIGEKPIPYLEADWFTKGSIADYILSETENKRLWTSPLHIVRTAADPTVTILSDHQQFQVNSSRLIVSCSDSGMFLQIMLQEVPRFIRPMNYYFGRLEYKEEMTVQLLLTEFGRPVENETIEVILTSSNSVPTNGVLAAMPKSTTNAQGIATFVFQAANRIPFPRNYSEPQLPCNKTELPINGQVYTFTYNASGAPAVNIFADDINFLIGTNQIAIHGFSYFSKPVNPTWVDDVRPIFSQYAHLYPVMRGILDLSKYSQVILPRNIHLLNYSMSLDFNHPSYMPVTRDIGTKMQNMILEWLNQKPIPTYSSSSYNDAIIREMCIHPCVADSVVALSYTEQFFRTGRCQMNCLDPSQDTVDPYLQKLYTRTHFPRNGRIRPLLNKLIHSYETDVCILEDLKLQLQQAVELEFATIPVYLTSMYSIVEGCNKIIYHKIRSVVIQEMQHMLQAANILIAIGGHPVIDSSRTVPSYPTRLPGGVLPNLDVTLKKFSREHVYRVFMGIEVPHNLSIDTNNPIIFNDTIGQFYQEISKCITRLGDSIFEQSQTEKQIMWPWNAPTVGFVNVISNATSALLAIQSITDQGEGTNPVNPTQGNSTIIENKMAHFYSFEEIVCGNRLVSNGEGQFCYKGEPIPFDPLGVWPMQPNPSKDKIPPNTNCYTEAKAFHGAYRALLRRLQEVFDGDKEGVLDMIAIMESLGVHARKVMWTNLSPPSPVDPTEYPPCAEVTCGPVWDYDWD